MERYFSLFSEASDFEQWFTGSKVVDESGNPLRVYHGTTSSFEQFSPTKPQSTFGERGVYFFTPDPYHASDYSTVQMTSTKVEGIPVPSYRGKYTQDESGGYHPEPGGNIRPVYLSIKNPFIVDLKDVQRKHNIEYLTGRIAAEVERNAIQIAKRKGHDGVILHNTLDRTYETGGYQGTIYVAFSPNQIRSIYVR